MPVRNIKEIIWSLEIDEKDLLVIHARLSLETEQDFKNRKKEGIETGKKKDLTYTEKAKVKNLKSIEEARKLLNETINVLNLIDRENGMGV